MTIRIGNGFDVHALATGRRLVLGGVTIPHEQGLDGHSDADVLLHAIVDRIARLHGGTFDLLPRDGGGTVARVAVPLAT